MIVSIPFVKIQLCVGSQRRLLYKINFQKFRRVICGLSREVLLDRPLIMSRELFVFEYVLYDNAPLLPNNLLCPQFSVSHLALALIRNLFLSNKCLSLQYPARMYTHQHFFSILLPLQSYHLLISFIQKVHTDLCIYQYSPNAFSSDYETSLYDLSQVEMYTIQLATCFEKV